MPAWFPMSTSRHRRGVVVVQFAVISTVMFGFVALVVDVGLLYNARTDLQRAADAAALAGASAYFSESSLAHDGYEVADLAIQRAQRFSLQNATLGKDTILAFRDITLGRYDFKNPTGSFVSGGPFNAVQVTTRRAPDSANGAVPFLFAGIFGLHEGTVTATAAAAVSDRLAGYRTGEDGGFLPFTIHEKIYDDRFVNGPDDFSYDDGIRNVGDGVPEVTLHPWQWKVTEEELVALEAEPTDGTLTGDDGLIVVAGPDGQEGSGNFGTLNIDAPSEGLPLVESQIRDGISAEQLEAEFGTSELMFHDEVDGPVTYPVSGNPGVALGMRDAIEERIGDVVGFFLHRALYDHGGGATYEICGVRFGRIVAVHLTGKPDQRALVIQPVAYTDGNVIVSSFAPSTDGQVGRIALVR